MFDLDTYEFKYLNTGKVTPEGSCMNKNSEEIHESEQVHNSTKQLCVILDAKYENAYLNKVMENQCQHFTEVKRNELIKLL